MSDVYEFAMGRKLALVLAGCFLASAVLLFVAGILTGMLVSGNRAATLRAGSESPAAKALPATALPKVPDTPVVPPVAGAGEGDGIPPASTSASSDARPIVQPELAVTPSSASAQPSDATLKAGPSASPLQAGTTATKATIARGGSTAEAQTANAASPSTAIESNAPALALPPRPAKASYAIPLAVKVGSFMIKSNADSLIVSLSDLGYRPMLSHFTDGHGRGWYLVKLGPYTHWNTASAVAAQVSVAENVRPIIGPMQ